MLKRAKMCIHEKLFCVQIETHVGCVGSLHGEIDLGESPREQMHTRLSQNPTEIAIEPVFSEVYSKHFAEP